MTASNSFNQLPGSKHGTKTCLSKDMPVLTDVVIQSKTGKLPVFCLL